VHSAEVEENFATTEFSKYRAREIWMLMKFGRAMQQGKEIFVMPT
jgi:hypothetical protein